MALECDVCVMFTKVRSLYRLYANYLFDKVTNNLYKTMYGLTIYMFVCIVCTCVFMCARVEYAFVCVVCCV